MEPLLRLYDSSSDDYRRAFALFLANTDQKQNTREWMLARVRRLPEHRLFIDAGAGNGEITAWISDQFERTIAIEPNDGLRAELSGRCPNIEVLGCTIAEAAPNASADLIVCSHVLYHVPRDQWLDHIDRMASWLAPAGELAVVLSSLQSDELALLNDFLNLQFDLRTLGDVYLRSAGGRFAVEVKSIPSCFESPRFEDAYSIAELVLNSFPTHCPPMRRDVEDYVRRRFAVDGGFRLSFHQDVLLVRRLS